MINPFKNVLLLAYVYLQSFQSAQTFTNKKLNSIVNLQCHKFLFNFKNICIGNIKLKITYSSINNYKNITYWLQWCSLNSHWWQTYHLPVLLSIWESKDDVPSVSAQENEISYTLGCCIYHHDPMLISYIALILLFIPSIVSMY